MLECQELHSLVYQYSEMKYAQQEEPCRSACTLMSHKLTLPAWGGGFGCLQCGVQAAAGSRGQGRRVWRHQVGGGTGLHAGEKGVCRLLPQLPRGRHAAGPSAQQLETDSHSSAGAQHVR